MVVDNLGLIKSYLTWQARNPAEDVRLAVPGSVLDYVLGPLNPLGLSTEQYTAWVSGRDGRAYLDSGQVERLIGCIRAAWCGEADPANRYIPKEQ